MMIHGQDYAQGALITENEWITFQFQAIQGPTGGLIQFPPRIKCRTDDVLLEETGKIRLITETPLNQTLETNIIHQRRPRSFSSDQFQPCESTKSRERERWSKGTRKFQQIRFKYRLWTKKDEPILNLFWNCGRIHAGISKNLRLGKKIKKVAFNKQTQ